MRKNKFIDHQSAVIYAWSLIILKETMNEIGGEDDKFAVYIYVNPLLHISYYRIAFDHLITSALTWTPKNYRYLEMKPSGAPTNVLRERKIFI